MRFFVIPAIALAISVHSSTALASNACVFPANWGPIPRTVNVFLAEGTGAVIGVSDVDFGEAISRAVTIWNEEAGTAVKLNWAGIRSTTTSTCPKPGERPTPNCIPGAITVQGINNPLDCPSIANFEMAYPLPAGTILYSLVNIYSHKGPPDGPCQQTTWRTDKEEDDFGPTEAFNHDLVGVLIHELGHAGHSLQHPVLDPQDDCVISPTPPSVMAGVPHNRVLRAWDKDDAKWWSADRAYFSVLKWTMFQDSTGTWGEITNLIAQFIAHRFGSLSQSFPYTVLAWTAHDPPELFDPFGQVRSTVYLTSSGSFGDSVELSDQFSGLANPVGVAASDLTNEVLVAYKRATNSSPYAVDFTFTCYKLSLDGGMSFGIEVCPEIAGLRYGMTAAYDPVSRTFLIAEAMDAGSLRVITVPGSGSAAGPRTTLLGSRSWHAPSIACSSTGVNNCLMAWEDKGSNGCLTWSRGRVDAATGEFIQTSVEQECYVQFETPSVAYYPRDDTFRLAFGQGASAAYSFVMPAAGGTWTGTGDIWNDPSSVISPPVLATERFCFLTCSDNLRAWFIKYK